MKRCANAEYVFTAKPSVPATIPFFAVALTSLWDFYFLGVRPLDFLAIFVIVVYWGGGFARPVNISRLQISALFLIGFVLLFGIGSLQEPESWKAMLGVTVGFMILGCVSCSDIRDVEVIDWMDRLLLLHLSTWALQMGVYLLSGVAINFHGWLGFESRLQWVIFRAAGLFQEPAHYCLMMFSMLVLRATYQPKIKFLQVAVLSTMLLSFSLWGLGAVMLYIALFTNRLGLWSMVTATLLVGIGGWTLVDPTSPVYQASVERIQNIGTDGSAAARYGALSSIDAASLADWSFWFGHGISADFFEFYGSNGLAFILYALGINGTILALGGICGALMLLRRWKLAVALVFMLSATSLWTIVWWWIWLALALTVNVSVGQVGFRRRVRDAMSFEFK